jgi:hypothetical protein
LIWGALSEDRAGLSFTTAAGFASAAILGSESRGTHDLILLSQIRDGQVPVFICPRNKVAQLHVFFFPMALQPFLGPWTHISVSKSILHRR